MHDLLRGVVRLTGPINVCFSLTRVAPIDFQALMPDKPRDLREPD
jgi:hypothetical protein